MPATQFTTFELPAYAESVVSGANTFALLIRRQRRGAMQRRELITLVGGAAVLPIPARAQQSDRVRRIGVLMGGVEGDAQIAVAIAAFTKALPDLGWTAGFNVSIDIRWSASNVERMRSLTKELVSLQPDLLFLLRMRGHRDNRGIVVKFHVWKLCGGATDGWPEDG